MQQIIGYKFGFLFVSIVFVCGLIFMPMPTSAHNGVDHSKEAAKMEMTSAQMEQMIKVLEQLIVLLTQYNETYGAYTPTSVYVAPSVSAEEVHDHHEEEHTGLKLVIEIEPHFGKTHVHVRYTDKPEEMFFIGAAIDNEDAVVADIVAHTGLTADAIRAALNYLE